MHELSLVSQRPMTLWLKGALAALLMCAACAVPQGAATPDGPAPASAIKAGSEEPAAVRVRTTPRLAAAGKAIPSERALMLASRTRARFGAEVESLLAQLVSFDTFHRDGTSNADHPSFQSMTTFLKQFAEGAGLKFADHGNVVVVSMGVAPDRLGVVTHGDVQPATPSKWARSPFELDTASEPGRLLGRGTEDDKGPIACALIAMRELAAMDWALERRIELIISYTEESDWGPFSEFLARNPPPSLNVAFDADYPVVVAEKGWCSVKVGLPEPEAVVAMMGPRILSLSGGFFLSQVPEDAVARLDGVESELETDLRTAAAEDADVSYSFRREGEVLTITAQGVSAHSSIPEEGRNAITHLAALLGTHENWLESRAARMVRFTNQLVGTGFYGELFGDLAHSDDFMGPLTLSFGTLAEEGGLLLAGINVRRPEGRSREQVEDSIRSAVSAWAAENGVSGHTLEMSIEPAHRVHDAPHVPILLETFKHYTGTAEAEPLSIGGGTHARMVPHGVNFGPAMPGALYTGHSEHEFITRKQLLKNLEMYTSLLVDLAVR